MAPSNKASLNIELSKTGVDRVRGGSDTVSGSAEVGELIKASALPLRLLNDSVIQYFNGAAAPEAETADEPEVLVPTNRDGEPDLPRRIKVQTGVLPRDTFDAPPAWFVQAVKRNLHLDEHIFPKHYWDDLVKPVAPDLIDKLQTSGGTNEFGDDVQGLDLGHLQGAPYCDDIEEAAVTLFTSHVSSNKLFDHWGWVETKEGNDVLVSEPYGGDMNDFQNLQALCDQFGWRFRVVGVSGHFPSATIRIEIRPR
jgi:hypothetical protein